MKKCFYKLISYFLIILYFIFSVLSPVSVFADTDNSDDSNESSDSSSFLDGFIKVSKDFVYNTGAVFLAGVGIFCDAAQFSFGSEMAINVAYQLGYFVDYGGDTYVNNEYYDYDNDSLILTPELTNAIKSAVLEAFQEQNENKIIYIKGRSYDGVALEKYRYIKPSMFTYASSYKAIFDYMSQYKYTIFDNSSFYRFYGFDSSYRYAYLDGSKIRFVDNYLKSINSVFMFYCYDTSSAFSYRYEFDYDALVDVISLCLESSNNCYGYNAAAYYDYFGNTSSVLTCVQQDSDTGEYYIYNLYGTIPVYSSLDALMDDYYSTPSYYFTDNFYNVDNSDTVINNVSNYNSQSVTNTYNTIVNGSTDAATAQEVQDIVNAAVQQLIDSINSGDDVNNTTDNSTTNNITNVSVDMTETNSILNKVLSVLYDIYDIDCDIYDNLADNDLTFDISSDFEDDLQDILSYLKVFGGLFEDINVSLEASGGVLESIDNSLLKLIQLVDSDNNIDVDVDVDDNDLYDFTGIINNFTFVETAKNKFPFSLPWDLYAVFCSLAAAPVTPTFELELYVPLWGIDEKINIDLSMFDTISQISRGLLSLTFAVYMIHTTKKLLPRSGGD